MDGKSLIELWGSELHGQLVRLNRYDLRLVERTAKEVRRRTSLVPEFPARRRFSEALCRFAARRRPVSYSPSDPDSALN